MGERKEDRQALNTVGFESANKPDSGTQFTDASSVLEKILEPVVRPGTVRLSVKLLRVAQDLRQQDFCLEPVLVSMVSAALEGIHGDTEAKTKLLVESVAAALYENAESRSRLQRLWLQLKDTQDTFS